jgi:hypothetical protein
MCDKKRRTIQHQEKVSNLKIELVLDDEGLVIEDKRFLKPGSDGRVFGLRLHDEAQVADQRVFRGGLQAPLAIVFGDVHFDAVLCGLRADPLFLENVLKR